MFVKTLNENTNMKTLLSLLGLVLISLVTSHPVQSQEMKEPSSKPSSSKVASSQDIKFQKATAFIEALTAKQKVQILKFLNEGSSENLIAVKGIAERRSKAIIGARPFTRVEDLVKLPGIGLTTFGSFVEYGKNPVTQLAAAES
jgi:Helix-hairpin-helix motif